jgi:3-methyladenine DNA glycosylase Mpg
MEIDMSINECDLCSSSLFVSKGSEPSNFYIETSPRILLNKKTGYPQGILIYLTASQKYISLAIDTLLK